MALLEADGDDNSYEEDFGIGEPFHKNEAPPGLTEYFARLPLPARMLPANGIEVTAGVSR